MVHRILFPFLKSRNTSRSQIEFIQTLLQLLPQESTEPCKLIWQILADFATIATDTRDEKDGNRQSEQPLGVDYRIVVRILEAGIALSPQQPPPGWKTLFEALANSATIDAGEAGRAIAVIEPLAKILLPNVEKSEAGSSGLFYCHLLIAKASYPKDRQALEAAKKRLWGSGNIGLKLSTFDPYSQLYNYIRFCLETSYDSFSKQNIHHYAVMLSTTSGLLGRCPSQLLLGTLTKLQQGIACWIMDGGSKLCGGNQLSEAVRSPSGSYNPS